MLLFIIKMCCTCIEYVSGICTHDLGLCVPWSFVLFIYPSKLSTFGINLLYFHEVLFHNL